MNFAQARANMVDSQIHPMGVVSDAVLNAFRALPRELFVPEGKQAIAYSDEDLPLGEGRWLMEPQVLARLVQASDPAPNDKVLVAGAGTGYAAAIFAMLAGQVAAAEDNTAMRDHGARIWAQLGLGNIAPLSVEAVAGTYSLIFVNGAVGDVPPALKNRMAVGGRMLVVVRERLQAPGKAMLVLRTAEDNWSERVLFDANIPFLPGMEPRRSFTF